MILRNKDHINKFLKDVSKEEKDFKKIIYDSRFIQLENEIKILQEFTGFRPIYIFKILFMIIGIILISLLSILLYSIINNSIFIYNTIFIIISILIFGYIVIMICIYLFIWGKKKNEFCLSCNRIKISDNVYDNEGHIIKKAQWKSLNEFGNFSHGLCDECANAFMDKNVMVKSVKIGMLLVNKNLITKEQLDAAINYQKSLRNKRIGDILVDKKFIDRYELEKAINNI
jgi:hypothetical protein